MVRSFLERDVSTNFKKIRKTLMYIIDNEISNEFFNASIDVENEDIGKVLNYFNKIYNIEYQIFDNKIIIKKTKLNSRNRRTVKK